MCQIPQMKMNEKPEIVELEGVSIKSYLRFLILGAARKRRDCICIHHKSANQYRELLVPGKCLQLCK